METETQKIFRNIAATIEEKACVCGYIKTLTNYQFQIVEDLESTIANKNLNEEFKQKHIKSLFYDIQTFSCMIEEFAEQTKEALYKLHSELPC